MPNVVFKDLNQIDYQEAWDIQEELFQKVVDQKLANRNASVTDPKDIINYFLYCEHPHVYTLGKSGSENNMLIDYIQLQAKNAKFYKINRGGDITYHGPGQIVGYPIIDLETFGLGVKEYIYLIEESIIQYIAALGIKGERLEGATGVWIDTQVTGKTRKICAIGVRASRYVTMHGFAFNVNTDLSYFNHINPCGFIDKGVTSLEKELGRTLPYEEVKKDLLQIIAQHFNMNFIEH